MSNPRSPADQPQALTPPGGADEDGARPLREVGTDPDARFSFANERTFLAWIRTALALVAAGLAITQLLPPFPIPGGRHIIGVPLLILGAVIAVRSYTHWEASERAMRLGRPLPETGLMRTVAVVIAAAAIIAAVLAVLGPK